jgi:hypothetical protein
MGEKHSNPTVTEADGDFPGSSDKIEEVLTWMKSIDILIPKPSEVREYLREYDDIIDLLCFVCKITREKFRNGSQLSLEVFHDPESDYRHLTLYVRKESYELDILDQLEEIDDQYGDMLSDKKGYVLVTTDFNSPIS